MLLLPCSRAPAPCLRLPSPWITQPLALTHRGFLATSWAWTLGSPVAHILRDPRPGHPLPAEPRVATATYLPGRKSQGLQKHRPAEAHGQTEIHYEDLAVM